MCYASMCKTVNVMRKNFKLTKKMRKKHFLRQLTFTIYINVPFFQMERLIQTNVNMFSFTLILLRIIFRQLVSFTLLTIPACKKVYQQWIWCHFSSDPDTAFMTFGTS